jgi:hypothetical protein
MNGETGITKFEVFMAASFLASLIIFTITGFYAVFHWMDLTRDPAVKVAVFVVVLLNAVFYHYMAGYTEMDPDAKKALETTGRTEWWVRVFNQSLLFCLWFSLEHSFKLFFLVLILVYVSYVVWDILTWDRFTKHVFAVIDFFGLGVTILFYLMYTTIYRAPLTTSKEPQQIATTPGTAYFYFGFICLIYLILPLFGAWNLRFNPFSARFMRRPELH